MYQLGNFGDFLLEHHWGLTNAQLLAERLGAVEWGEKRSGESGVEELLADFEEFIEVPYHWSSLGFDL